MKWVLIAIGVLSSLIVLPVFVGSLLPMAHTATVEATVEAPLGSVWTAITDIDDYARWRPDVERTDDTETDPLRWTEVGGSGRLPMEVVDQRPEYYLVVRIVDDGLPFGGTWTYELYEHPDGTQLRITEDGQVRNPAYRFVSRFMIGHEATLRSFLGNLTADLGGSVHP